jgi:hypothetical protein
MKIKGSNRLSSTSGKKPVKSTGSGSDFHSAVSVDETKGASGVSGSQPIQSIDSLLSFQEVPDSTSARSKGLVLGKDMLDHLEDIRRGLLLGSISKARLKTLAQVMKERRDKFQDPDLTDLLDQIELRARVELAKLEMLG